jgi:hypothetical protein
LHDAHANDSITRLRHRRCRRVAAVEQRALHRGDREDARGLDLQRGLKMCEECRDKVGAPHEQDEEACDPGGGPRRSDLREVSVDLLAVELSSVVSLPIGSQSAPAIS